MDEETKTNTEEVKISFKHPLDDPETARAYVNGITRGRREAMIDIMSFCLTIAGVFALAKFFSEDK